MKIRIQNSIRRLVYLMITSKIGRSVCRICYLTTTYSQFGEDVILRKSLNIYELIKKQKGIYVDVGCNHPIDYSNTFGLYLEGWSGITIDANEDLVQLHKKRRKRDTQVCAIVSNEEGGVKTFYKSSLPLVSTVSEEFKKDWEDKATYSPIQVVVKSLNTILEEHLPTLANTCQHTNTIDLLSIDVEGHDYEVLQSIDLKKYHPTIIIIEIHGFDIEKINQDKIYNYMKIAGYRLVAFAGLNAYFVYEQ